MSTRLASERVIVSAPMSYTGSAKRIWRLTELGRPAWLVLTVLCAVIAVALAWVAVTIWYGVFGILLVPYRLIRRGSRKNKREQLRQREILEAVRPRD